MKQAVDLVFESRDGFAKVQEGSRSASVTVLGRFKRLSDHIKGLSGVQEV